MNLLTFFVVLSQLFNPIDSSAMLNNSNALSGEMTIWVGYDFETLYGETPKDFTARIVASDCETIGDTRFSNCDKHQTEYHFTVTNGRADTTIVLPKYFKFFHLQTVSKGTNFCYAGNDADHCNYSGMVLVLKPDDWKAPTTGIFTVCQ